MAGLERGNGGTNSVFASATSCNLVVFGVVSAVFGIVLHKYRGGDDRMPDSTAMRSRAVPVHQFPEYRCEVAGSRPLHL